MLVMKSNTAYKQKVNSCKMTVVNFQSSYDIAMFVIVYICKHVYGFYNCRTVGRKKKKESKGRWFWEMI